MVLAAGISLERNIRGERGVSFPNLKIQIAGDCVEPTDTTKASEKEQRQIEPSKFSLGNLYDNIRTVR